MNRRGNKLGVLLPGSPEDIRFRGYFGLSAEVALEVWEMMEELDCLPPSPRLQHYLWALALGGPAQRSCPLFFCSGGNLFFFDTGNLQKLNRLPTDQQQIATSFLTTMN